MITQWQTASSQTIDRDLRFVLLMNRSYPDVAV